MADFWYTTVDGSAILLVDLSSVYMTSIYIFLPSRLQDSTRLILIRLFVRPLAQWPNQGPSQ